MYQIIIIIKVFLLKFLKNYDEALQFYDKAIELNPKNSWVYNNKGNILRELERYNEAIQCYDTAI